MRTDLSQYPGATNVTQMHFARRGTVTPEMKYVAARERLEADGVRTRVVSVPCVEWFADQDQAYKDQVLPPSVRARV